MYVPGTRYKVRLLLKAALRNDKRHTSVVLDAHHWLMRIPSSCHRATVDSALWALEQTEEGLTEKSKL